MARFLAQARCIIGAVAVALVLAVAAPATAQRNPDGSVVWEYANPYFGPRLASQANKPEALVNQVFRAYRYSAAEIERAQRAT